MIPMIDTNKMLIDFVSSNWMAMVIVYGILKVSFPNSKAVIAIGDLFSGLFPVFSAKKREGGK